MLQSLLLLIALGNRMRQKKMQCPACDKTTSVRCPFPDEMRLSGTQRRDYDAWKANLTCKVCNGALVPYNNAKHNKNNSKKLRQNGKGKSERQRLETKHYMESMVKAGQMVNSRPQPVHCPRCRERVATLPSPRDPCPHCFDF